MLDVARQLIKILDKVTPGASRSLGWEMALTGLIFPASILVNRTLGAEERGLFSLVLLVPSTIIILGTCQWDRLVRGLITSKQISPKEAWRRTIYYSWWLSIIIIPLGIIASLAYIQLSLPNRLLSAIYSLSFPIIMLSGSLSSIYLAAGSINRQYSMRIAYQTSYIFLVFGLLSLDWLSVSSLVIIYIIIWSISLLVGLFRKGKYIKGIIFSEKPSFSPLIKSFLPYAFESFSLNADTWAFSLFSPLASLGYYVGIKGLMQPIGLLSNALNSGSTARLNWTNSSVVRRYLLKYVFAMISMLLGLVVGGTLIGTDLIGLFLGKSFSGGEWMIPWISLIVVSNAIGTQFHFALQFSGLKNAYLLTQTIYATVRFSLILSLGWQFAELGIFLGCIFSAIIKCMICSYFLLNFSSQKY
ncbi:lipopolysaccharide biosynthesis protein [Calothrix rhizosoleniae]|uniref:lipopolysaccharide biosynthesis protein n=1 Tax=Calothrix rhizosoleniae TaxID=888997 RepID=UPI000B4A20ED|nr:hypothetical protein [Calothrix rhizosoleniae]